MILEAAQRLEALDFTGNSLSRWPEEYFSSENFDRLEYINVNFNLDIIMPEVCVRTAFCFKKTYLESRSGNDVVAISDDQDDLISRSQDSLVYPHVNI